MFTRSERGARTRENTTDSRRIPVLVRHTGLIPARLHRPPIRAEFIAVPPTADRMTSVLRINKIPKLRYLFPKRDQQPAQGATQHKPRRVQTRKR